MMAVNVWDNDHNLSTGNPGPPAGCGYLGVCFHPFQEAVWLRRKGGRC